MKMPASEFVSGQQHNWSLVNKLGEGDAGDVYLAESLLDKKVGILKRPRRSAFSSEIIRQASQIETEGKILRALGGLPNGQAASDQPAHFYIPGLLDYGQAGTEFSERYFIVVEQAPGFDLNTLARLARFGRNEPGEPGPLPNRVYQTFLDRLAEQGKVPDLILLRALLGLFDLFDRIHYYRVLLNGNEQAGVIWNDVKPEHLFWDPGQGCFTVIDWGNGQFLEANGATKDRRFARSDDYAQFIQQMGKFLSDTSPTLYEELAWPDVSLPVNDPQDVLPALKETISGLLYEHLETLREIRQSEEVLIHSDHPEFGQLHELEELHNQILDCGELPDYPGAEEFLLKLALGMIAESNPANFGPLCQKARTLPTTNLEKWTLLEQIGSLAAQCSGTPQRLLNRVLLSGLNEDWPSAHWDLLLVGQGGPEPAWLADLSGRMRQIELQTGPDAITPFVTVSRLAHAIQAVSIKIEDSIAFRPLPLGMRETNSLGETPPTRLEDQVRDYAAIVSALREETLPRWKDPEPDLPDSGLEYQDIDRLTPGIIALQPEAEALLSKALDQPKAQVKIVLDAWNRKEFETALRGLRRVLLWDPERVRVFTAEASILKTPAWLSRVTQGPGSGDLLQDFMTHLELDGRELRNHIGPARWLDLILESLAKLRKGASPADLVLEHPELLNEIPWLTDYEARRPAPAPRSQPVILERGQSNPEPASFLNGFKEGSLAPQGDLLLEEPLDTWAPEARGSSARVFMGFLRNGHGQMRQSAIKVLRAEKADYGLPLFREETQILALMRDVPGVTGLLECGYINLEGGAQLPPDDRPADASHLTGKVLRFGANEIRNFIAGLDTKTGQGWLPYLAIEKKNRENNLMTLCDAGYTHGRFLPVAESLRLAIQICDILQAAHVRNIVYRDHKILHYYWQEANNGIFVIDWNVAQRHPQGLSKAEKQFDLVQFGARALHHILTGRTAPGALPLGPTRPDEIEHASLTYHVHWTYDDQRLPTIVKEILEKVLAGEYSEVKPLRDDLCQVFLQLPETVQYKT